MNKVLKYFIISFIGLVAAAHASRMIVGYLCGQVYKPTLFDVLFDWGLLLLMGFILVYIGVPRLYEKIKMCKTWGQ